MRVTFAKERSAEDQAKADASKAASAKRKAEKEAKAKARKAEGQAEPKAKAEGGDDKPPAKAKKNKKKPKGDKPKGDAPAGTEAAPKKEEAKKPGRDFGAEKLARKAAEMPDVDPDIDLAALRAKAQGGKMTDEEKKKRGLLYDTSKASAVREDSDEDDEGACDMGGDPFEGL